MGAHRIVIASLVAAFASIGCGSGDGVPKAAVANYLNGCIVEAAWYDDQEDPLPYGRAYGWSEAFGTNGQSSAREVVEGQGYAYAVVVSPGSAGCPEAAMQMGGTLYKTTQKERMTPGNTTIIKFSDTTAEEAKDEVICRFCRLGCCAKTAPTSSGTP